MKDPTPSSAHILDPDVLQRLGRLDLIAREIANALRQGLHRSRLHGFSTEFSDFKQYTPGDDLRFLDWRIYARTDRLLVRKYEAETSFESILLLDASRSMAWRWEEWITKLEYAVNLFAAMAFIHIENQDLVGLIAHDGAEPRYLPPHSAKTQLERIFRILEEVRPGGADTLPLLAGVLAPLKRHRGQIVVCSDLEEDEEGTRAALEALAGRDDEILVLHLLDRAEIDLPFRDPTHFEDSETGEVIPVDLARLRRSHQRTVEDFRETWRSRCEAWGIRYQPIHTGMGYVEVLMGLAV